MDVQVKPIFVAYQATNEAMLAAATSSASAQASASTQAADQQQTSASTSTSSGSGGSGLSGGAVAGVAVGAVIAGFLVALLTLLLLRFCCGYRIIAAGRKKGDDGSVVTASHNHYVQQRQYPSAPELPSLGQMMTERHELGTGDRNK